VSLKPKKSLNILDILALVQELRDIVVGKFIDKVYREDTGLLLRIKTEVEKYFLIFTKHRIGITRYIVEEDRKRDPILKNLVERCRIEDLYMPRIDRIIHLKLSSGQELIFELIEPTNIILIDSEGKIRWCLHKYEGKDRKIHIGLKYVPPPRNFLDLFNCSIEAYLAELERCEVKDKIRAISRVLGIPVDIVREACKREGIENLESKYDYIKILERIREIFREVIDRKIEPRIYIDESSGNYITVTPIKLLIYEEKYRPIIFKSFNEAVDEYFRKIEFEEREKEKISKIESEIRKLEKSIEDVQKLINEYLEKAEEYQRKGRILLENKYVIEDLLTKIRELWNNYREDFEDLVRGIVFENVKIIQYIPQEKSIVIQIFNENIKIPIHQSLRDVIESMFNKSKELKKKAENAKKALEDLYKKYEELKKRIEISLESIREKTVEVVYGVYEWFEKFKWFITTNNKLVIAGKDASQNEAIVRRYLRKRDLFFHADIPGGAVVILFSTGSDVTSDDVYQAAKYAAANSKAWIIGASSIDVFYVNGEQVSKEAPAGEYLSKGSFMIYGERRWIRGVPLELAIGVRVDEHESKKIIRILSAPPEAISRLAEYYIIIKPGNIDKNRCSELIREKIIKYIKEKYNISPKVRPEDIIIHIPGNSTIVKEDTSNNVLHWYDIKKIVKM